MGESAFRFGRFSLDMRERQLRRDGQCVSVSGRYLDALALLVRESGALVTKERLHEEVWRGIPVTDEALTQCVRTLRRELGDNASDPRFIETVPKHGYRFIAPVEQGETPAPAGGPSPTPGGAGSKSAGRDWHLIARLAAAGAGGGLLAGLIGGLGYGFAAAVAQPGEGLSIVLVLILITALVAALGAGGVACGIAAAGFGAGRQGSSIIAGGAAGGLIVGAIVKLLGLDAFELLVGRSPGDITGAGEGALLGAAVGLAARWGLRSSRPALSAQRLAAPALAGGLAGLVVPLLGGEMMGGSLALLAQHFPQSRLRLDALGRLFGENGFGPITQMATGALEGALFATCIVGAMLLALKRGDQRPPEPVAVPVP